MKLKQNLPYAFLSILFPTVTGRYYPDIVRTMIDILSEVLKKEIHFPSLAEILRNMQHCFKNYSDTRFILDCTEIEIRRPKKLCCQITTYSLFKSRHTLKFLTHKVRGTSIMVDKGSFIEETCSDYHVKLDRPAFLRGIIQFSATDNLVTADIASA